MYIYCWPNGMDFNLNTFLALWVLWHFSYLNLFSLKCGSFFYNFLLKDIAHFECFLVLGYLARDSLYTSHYPFITLEITRHSFCRGSEARCGAALLKDHSRSFQGCKYPIIITVMTFQFMITLHTSPCGRDTREGWVTHESKVKSCSRNQLPFW